MAKTKKTKLNEKQKLFCSEYLVDFNGTRAALAAGYAKSSARGTASRMLTNNNIQEEITRLADEKNKENGNAIERIILELQLIAYGDYKDLVEWDEHGVKKWVPSEELGDKTRLVQEISETVGKASSSRKIKLYDKMRALEMLGRYHKIFTDKVEHSNPDGSLAPVVNINVPSNGREKGDNE